jgi:D-alanyl-D-alanine carboxypeptidase (penicillin-binding protein 5/6)
VDGLKTGWIGNNDGFHLVATASRGAQRFIAVVMGAGSQSVRENEALKLLNYGFKNYATVTLCNLNDTMETLKVWKGASSQVTLVTAESGVVTVPTGQQDTISLEKLIPKRVFAPIAKGQIIGELRITADGTSLKKIALIAQDEVASGGIITYLFHTFMLSFLVPPYVGWMVLVLLVLVLIIARGIQRKA